MDLECVNYASSIHIIKSFTISELIFHCILQMDRKVVLTKIFYQFFHNLSCYNMERFLLMCVLTCITIRIELCVIKIIHKF